MKYRVEYLQPKKKKDHYIKQEATLLDIESAIFWESVLQKRGAKDIKILPT
jgi:hypothetical protein